jgi:hypothetical protein
VVRAMRRRRSARLSPLRPRPQGPPETPSPASRRPSSCATAWPPGVRPTQDLSGIHVYVPIVRGPKGHRFRCLLLAWPPCTCCSGQYRSAAVRPGVLVDYNQNAWDGH